MFKNKFPDFEHNVFVGRVLKLLEQQNSMDEFEVFRARAHSCGSAALYFRQPVLASRTKKKKLFYNHMADDIQECGDDAELANRLQEIQLQCDHNGSTESDDMTHDDDNVFDEKNMALTHAGWSTPGSPATTLVSSNSYSHGRSISYRCRAKRPTNLDLGMMRPRTRSMPTKNSMRKRKVPPRQASEDSEYYRVRTFSTSSKGIINRGDSFKRRMFLKNISVDSMEDTVRTRLSSTASQSSLGSASSIGEAIHRVIVIGDPGVGKTSLIQQFMTSEYMGHCDVTEEEDDLVSRSVSVLLDGEEASLIFTNVSDIDTLDDDYENADAYVAVYSVTDRESFDDAVDTLHALRKRITCPASALILVANKGDIVRSREITEEEGKVMAVRYSCKYIEVSAVLNHKVDELLAGILKQIRLNSKRRSKRRSGPACLASEETSCMQYAARGIVDKLFSKTSKLRRFHSCDNLLVL